MKAVPKSVTSPGWSDWMAVAHIDPVSQTVTVVGHDGTPLVYPMRDVRMSPDSDKFVVPIATPLWTAPSGPTMRAVAFVFEGSAPSVVLADGSIVYKPFLNSRSSLRVRAG